MKIGADFGLNRYSSVSSAVMRVKNRLQKGRKFKHRLEQIKSNILKNQTKTPLTSKLISCCLMGPQLHIFFDAESVH